MGWDGIRWLNLIAVSRGFEEMEMEEEEEEEEGEWQRGGEGGEQM